MPGTVAGLALAQEKYGSGKLSLAELIAPAIRLAQQGFPVEDDTADSLPRAKERLARWPSSAGIFLNGGEPLHDGDRLLQFDLADTLRRSRKTARTHSTKAASPCRSPTRCAPPAAS